MGGWCLGAAMYLVYADYTLDCHTMYMTFRPTAWEVISASRADAVMGDLCIFSSLRAFGLTHRAAAICTHIFVLKRFLYLALRKKACAWLLVLERDILKRCFSYRS